MVDDVLLQHPAAHRPPGRDQVPPTGQTQRLQEAVDVVGHVAESPGGVDRLLLGSPERAHVGSDDPHIVGEQVSDVAPVPTGSDVAVDQQDRASVLGATGPDVHRETRGLDHLGGELGHLGAPSNYAGGAVLAPAPDGRSAVRSRFGGDPACLGKPFPPRLRITTDLRHSC